MTDSLATKNNDPNHLRRSAAQVATVETSALFGGAREIVLLHNGEHYRLRVTQNGKLILTK